MSLDGWDEIRTAFHVARLGTVSGAADVLGVHHATVIRHIDALEGRLTTKLFQRHARGYTATEAGMDLLQVAQATDDQLTQLVGRLKGRGDSVTGELVVTSLGVLTPLLVPVMAQFQMAHPDVILRFLTDERVFRLEYGEAHVAIRAAATAPGQPDNVVQKLFVMQNGMYATRTYLDRYGKPETVEDLAQHLFVANDDTATRAPFHRWLWDRVPPDRVIYRGTDMRGNNHAILSHLGIGFMSDWEASRYPELVQMFEPQPDWHVPLWLVTHVDLHRTAKVQSLLKHIKAEFKDWPAV